MPMHHWNPFSKERRLERRDAIIGWLMFLGFLLAIPGGIIVYFLSVGGGLGSIRIDGTFVIVKYFPLVGAVMYLCGLGYGIYSEKNEYTGTRRTLKQCRIIARYAITRDHRMVTDESEFEFLDRPKYFVKMLHPQEGSIEYQCVPPVFFNCGEGMMGDADVQGQWLGGFRPYIGMPQTHVGERF